MPTFIDIVPFLINIVPTNNLFLKQNTVKYGSTTLKSAYAAYSLSTIYTA